jgi:hypothetical protein
MDTRDIAAPQEPRLFDRMRDKIRLKHYSIRTEFAYLDWVRRFILFHAKRHLGSEERPRSCPGDRASNGIGVAFLLKQE